jgi:hypothetical protein
MPAKSSPFLKINRFRIAGKRHRDIPFAEGLNIIEGDNGLGKTTLLRLLQFGLGLQQPIQGSTWKRAFIPELNDSEAVLAELEINEKPYTVQREINKNSDTAIVSSNAMDDLFRSERDYSIKGREFSDFLLSTLHVPPVEIQGEFGNHSRTMFLTFDYLYQMMYLDQDVGYTAIGNTMPERLRIACTELLLGIINTEYYDLEISDQVERDRRTQLNQELRHIQSFIENLDMLPLTEINTRHTKLIADRDELNQEIIRLKQEMRANPDYPSDLREQLIHIDSQLDGWQTQVVEMEQSLARFDLAEASINQERERVQRTTHARTVLSHYSVQVCPNCNQALDKEMYVRRLQNLCELCGRPMPRVDELEWRQKVLQDEQKEIVDLRKKRRQELEVLSQRIQQEHLKRREIAQQFDTLRDQFVNDLINQIEERRLRLTIIEQELALLDYYIRVQDSIEKIQEEIRKIDDDLAEILERKQQQARQIEESHQVIRDLQSALAAFVHSIKIRDLGTIEIDPEDYSPKIAGRSYKLLSTTQRDLIILGYYYALLRVSLSRATNHPRLLVIDTVRKDDIDQDTMIKCLTQFEELKNLFGVPFQVIVAMREVPAEFRKYIQLELHNDDYLLTSRENAYLANARRE